MICVPTTKKKIYVLYLYNKKFKLYQKKLSLYDYTQLLHTKFECFFKHKYFLHL